MRVIDEKIADFLATINLGLEWIGDAGKKLADMVDSNPAALDDILDSKPPDWITREVLLTIEAIGRKQIAPELLILPLHVFNRLAVLPTEAQIKAMQGVDVMTRGGNGKRAWHRVNKPACRLNKEEARRAIGPNGIRSPDEQVRFNRTERERNVPRPIGMFRVRVNPAGEPIFEKETKEVGSAQNVLLMNGEATIKVCLWK